RSHMLERRPVLEEREDADYGLRSAIQGMRAKASKMELDRLPTKYAREDAEFDMRQRRDKQALSIQGMQAELTRMGLDEKRLQANLNRARDAVGRGIAHGMQTGDWGGLAQAYNATIGG